MQEQKLITTETTRCAYCVSIKPQMQTNLKENSFEMPFKLNEENLLDEIQELQDMIQTTPALLTHSNNPSANVTDHVCGLLIAKCDTVQDSIVNTYFYDLLVLRLKHPQDLSYLQQSDPRFINQQYFFLSDLPQLIEEEKLEHKQ